MSDYREQVFVNANQMSEITGISASALKWMAECGEVPTVRQGKFLLFDRVGTIEALRAKAAANLKPKEQA